MEAGGKDASALLDETRKRVFLLHDVHRKEPALVETRWAMSYLRGPMTKQDLARLRGRPPPPAPRAGRGAAAGAAPPPLPSAWPARWVEKRDADIASPALFVKYAVRFRLGNGVPPGGDGREALPAGRVRRGRSRGRGLSIAAAGESARRGARRALRYSGTARRGSGAAGVKAVEKAVRSRLPDKLATTLLRDPVTGALSLPGESAEDFARARGAGAEPPAALRDRLEKKRRDLAAAEAGEQGRSMETIASIGTAALGRPRRVSREAQDAARRQGRIRPDEETDGGHGGVEGRRAEGRDRRSWRRSSPRRTRAGSRR